MDNEIAKEFAQENGINFKSSVSSTDYNKIFKVSYINVKDIIMQHSDGSEIER